MVEEAVLAMRQYKTVEADKFDDLSAGGYVGELIDTTAAYEASRGVCFAHRNNESRAQKYCTYWKDYMVATD